MKKLPLAALLAVFLCSGAIAATITVQSTADGAANAANCPGAGCRLRDAIAAANDSDTIDFSVTGAITLNSGELAIGKNITISGPGALSLAVDGNNATRVFHILPGETVTISDLTIRNGRKSSEFFGGGGIYNDHATLMVNNCAITANSVLTASSPAIGGGIFNDAQNGGLNASLTLNNCTINGNSVLGGGGHPGLGGGIGNSATNGATATLNVTNCTISGNAAFGGNSRGGGIWSSGIPGGIEQLTVNNSTFSGNSVGTPNGAGAAVSAGALNTANTIYDAGQTAFNVASFGYNICAGPNCGGFNGPGDQNNVNPNLGPLQNNGGQTSTHAPLCGSPAIDQGKNLLSLSTDERGAQRTFDMLSVPNVSGGDGTDVGAVESPVRTFPVTNAADLGAGTLRQAVSDANGSAGTDLIALPPSVVPINVSSAELLVTDCACISGPGPSQVTVNGNNVTRVFHIAPDINVDMGGFTLANGNTGSNGGGILNDHSSVAIDRCVLGNNSAALGGGIYNDGSTNSGTGSASLIVNDSTLSGNTASNGGGAIFNYALNTGSGSTSVDVTILNSTLNNNSTSNTGGGIENYGVGNGANGLVAITNSTLSANSAATGGGVYNIGDSGNASVTINNSTLSGNTASSNGGAVYNTAAPGSGGNAALNTANTIYNAGAAGGTIFSFFASVNSAGYNLASDNPGYLNGTGDLNNTNPQLGPLQGNGGPTATHALGTNSPAREAGNPSFDPNAFNPPMIYDQRGFNFPRVLGRLDIGAFELPAPLALNSATSLAFHILPSFPPTIIPVEIVLPLSGNPGIECRASDGTGPAGSRIIIFYFNNQMSSVDNASVSCGTVSSFGLNGNPTNSCFVQFDGSACNEQYVTVTLTGLHDTYGQTLASASVIVGLLDGDTNADRRVNVGDTNQTKSRSGQTINSGNFRSDVNLDARINVGDTNFVKSHSGTSLGP